MLPALLDFLTYPPAHQPLTMSTHVHIKLNQPVFPLCLSHTLAIIYPNNSSSIFLQQSYISSSHFFTGKKMLNSSSSQTSTPHVALFASAGMGHLIPSLRLAAMLSSRNCLVTLVTAKPSVSAAETAHISSFISTHPKIKILEFQILPSTFEQIDPTINDPFFKQFEAIRRSINRLHPLLSSSSPPFSAIFSDIALASSIAQVAADLCIPNYIVVTTSAKFLSLMSYLLILTAEPTDIISGDCNEISIPGTSPLPKSSIPPPFSNPNHFFTKEIISHVRVFSKAKGILVNTFDWFESETLAALNNGNILSNLPPILPVGPFEPYQQLEKEQCQFLPWLDNQPAKSVAYVSYGSRTALSKDQIREIGNGLERSGFRFLWVVKSSKVDKDDKEEVKDLLGDLFIERTKNKGMVVKGWVNQEDILAHPAIGGFICHCGWNSVTEAARRGIPVLAWPQNGDQKVNAEVVVKARLGIWERDWGWAGEKTVKGDEIGEKIREMMEGEKLKHDARKVGEEASKAWGPGGSSEKALVRVIEMLKKDQEMQ